MSVVVRRMVLCFIISAGCWNVAAAQVRDSVGAPTVVGTAKIGGVVTTVQAQPIRRARVLLLRLGGSADAVQSTTTDDDGRFLFESLPAGRYRLRATKPAWLDATYAATRPGGPGLSFPVADGQRITELSLRMARAGVISGRFVRPNGEPAAGVGVRVMRYVTMPGGDRTLEPAGQMAASITDDRGEYRVYGLRPGDYLVAALPAPVKPDTPAPRLLTATDVTNALAAAKSTMSGSIGVAETGTERISLGIPISYSPIFYPGTTNLVNAQIVAIDIATQRENIDLQLQYVPVATVFGTISTTIPVLQNSIQVSLVPTESVLVPEAPRTVQPAPDGRFSFRDVAAGSYLLLARAVTANDPQSAESSKVPSIYGRAEVLVSGTDISQTVDLRPGATVAGTVSFTGSREPSLADRGPISFRLIPTSSEPSIANPTSVLDASQSFNFVGVPPGNYRLAVTAPRLDGKWFLESAIVQSVDLLDMPHRIDAFGETDHLAVTFTDSPSEVKGILRDSQDRPVSDYFVVVFPTDRTLWTAARRIERTRPEITGAFQIRGLPTGDYYIAVATDLDPYEGISPALLEQLMSSGLRITVTKGQTTSQDIRLAGK